MLKKEYLDERICDGTEGSTNTQTWREFIKESETTFEMEEKNLEELTDDELDEYINFLDYLWEK